MWSVCASSFHCIPHNALHAWKRFTSKVHKCRRFEESKPDSTHCCICDCDSQSHTVYWKLVDKKAWLPPQACSPGTRSPGAPGVVIYIWCCQLANFLAEFCNFLDSKWVKILATLSGVSGVFLRLLHENMYRSAAVARVHNKSNMHTLSCSSAQTPFKLKKHLSQKVRKNSPPSYS